MTEITLTSHTEAHKTFAGWVAANESMAMMYALGIASTDDVNYFIDQSEKFVAALQSHGEDYSWDGDQPEYEQRECEQHIAEAVSETVAEVRALLADADTSASVSDEVLDQEFRALLAEVGITFDQEPEDQD